MRVQTDLNDLIEEEGEGFVHTRILVIPENVDSLEGIDRFDSIEKIKIRREYVDTEDGFEDEVKINDYSLLATRPLQESLIELDLDGNASLTDISFISGFKRLLTIDLGDCVNIRNYSPLESKSLGKTVERIRFAGNRIRNFDFLKGYRRLRTLDIEHTNIKNHSVIALKNLQRTLRSLSIAAEHIKNLKFLSGYQNLEYLGIIGCSCDDFSGLSSENISNSIEELSMWESHWFRDLSYIKGYKKLKRLELTRSGVRDISDLLDYEFVRNGSLREITLPDSIDWTMVRNGRYISEHVVRTLRNRGVKVNLPDTFPFSEDERPRKTLAEYLSDLKLRDHDVKTICDWFHEDRLWKEMPFEEQIRFVDEQSFHETFEVETAQGGELILKVQPSRLKAEIEQAANYYLSPVFGFIAPTDCREPFEYCGLYLTVQNRVENRQAEIMDLPYHLACLAKLHAHGKEIMEGNGVTLPIKEIPEFLEVYEVIRYAAHRHPDISRSIIKERKGEYEESRHRLMNGKQVLLHGDLKKQNRFGRYFLDLEGICTGDSTLDLATVLNDCKMYLGDQKRAYLSIYQHFYAKETGTEFREEDIDRLLDRLKGAELVRGTQSIAWNLVYINEEGETAREKLGYLSTLI